MKRLVAIALLACTSGGALATPLGDYVRCTTPVIERHTKELDQLAVRYPKFGVALAEKKGELQQIIANNNPQTYIADAHAIHQRFVDRVLQTAEREAVQLFNSIEMQRRQGLDACGPMPKPQQ